ncbi:MAG TPA: hypothetical protein VGV60_17120 [Candidatus Polarisedimenticolia bacterium]|nr:hypothetical protein [Candidatus Polarisedimenticolia bacterium]
MNGGAAAAAPAARSGASWTALLLLPVLGFWTARLASGAQTSCFLDLVNLAFHEAGHLVLIPFGSTLHYLGGTLGQLAVPALLAGCFLLRPPTRPLGAAFCTWWIGENCINISVYMRDARDLALPLVGGGDHDWNELFYRFGLLGEDSVRTVADLTHHLGVVVMLMGLAWIACFALPDRPRDGLREALSRHAPALLFLIEPSEN